MRVPQYLHRPLQVLWWESDEFGMVLMGLFLWLAFGGYIFIGLGIALPSIYSRLKKKYNRGFLNHLMYFAGLKRFRGYPDFFVKEFTE